MKSARATKQAKAMIRASEVEKYTELLNLAELVNIELKKLKTDIENVEAKFIERINAGEEVDPRSSHLLVVYEAKKPYHPSYLTLALELLGKRKVDTWVKNHDPKEVIQKLKLIKKAGSGALASAAEGFRKAAQALRST